MQGPWIQVSIDTQNITSAGPHIECALAADAEWIEVGTPLLTFAGIDSIQQVAERVSPRTVVADFKALDGVAQYFTHAGRLGAGVATVMAVANPASIAAAIESGHAAGVKIQVDLLNIPREEIAHQVVRLEDMGADHFLLHLAIDELTRNPAADPLCGLDEAVQAAQVPVGPVVFSAEQAVDAVRRGASYVVIGYPLLQQENAKEALTEFAQAVRGAGGPSRP